MCQQFIVGTLIIAVFFQKNMKIRLTNYITGGNLNTIQFNKTLIKSGGGMCPMKPSNHRIYEVVLIHKKAIAYEDERKNEKLSLNLRGSFFY